ncbi:uncharacterized protein LOC105850393 isoform X3 [Hydra vulgaris]|uniref:uncharacterized protein LOC105850393 isoform X3 n=1 Tax=Hydra vulgaris TaxID=6087 RepID=UPI001F5FB8C6|nr:uncharacterized protein LOC105850393 isoform X3 [Hydra vulgaris]
MQQHSTLLVIDPNSMPKNTNYTLGEGRLVYKCKTNLEAKFLWKVCRSFHPDVWHEESSYISCEKMLKKQSHYCKDVKPNAITKNDYYYLDNGVMGYFSQLLLDHVQQPHKGCILCTAIRGNSVVNAFTQYEYRDECGRPSHQEAAFTNYKICRSRSGYNLTKKKCWSSKPEGLEVFQKLDDLGFVDTYVKWKNPKGSNDGIIYGYEITVDKINERETDYTCYIINRYDEIENNDMQNLLDKLKLSIEENSDHILYTANVSDLIGYREFSQQAEYNISVKVLPISEPATITFKESSQEDMCNDYYKKNNFLPLKCYMVTNIAVLNCFPNKLVNISWDIEKHINLKNLSGMISIWWANCNGNEFNHKLKMDQKYFVFHNKSSTCASGLIELTFSNTSGYPQYFSFNCSEKLKNEKKTAENKIAIYITAAALVTVLSICLALAIKFIRNFIYLLKKLQAFKNGKCVSFEELDIQNVSREGNISVMIVRPRGCGILEELVLALANILNSNGINVLAEFLQAEKINNKGLAVVLQEDFEKADYVVILCTEPIGSPLEIHNSYKFVINQLLSNNALKGDSLSKYIAVYFDSCDKFVPCYLHQRTYLLPTFFDAFILNLYGVQFPFPTIISKMLKETREMVKKKKQFRLLCEKLKDSNHIDCDPNNCRKANFEARSSHSSLSRFSFESSGNINDEEFDFQNNFIIQKKVFLKKPLDETNL